MNNFLEFIERDVLAKKGLISTIPTKTKTNIKKYNLTLNSMEEKYEEYKISVRNYLLAKSRSFNIKSNTQEVEELNNNVTALQRVKFLLNPSNGYIEKMGFDSLLYKMANYHALNFKSLVEIINEFIDKFDLVGIRLKSHDFDYTCYVHEYMTSFLETRYSTSTNYDKVTEIFEQIYWLNPEIIDHIELNFRKLIRLNAKKFSNYIAKLQKEAMNENKIKNYTDCIEKLKGAYIELNLSNKEDICDIINSAKTGEIDINNYLEDSKFRKGAYSSLLGDKLNLEDSDAMEKIYNNLEKLKANIEEYNNYLDFEPLFNDFKAEYEKLIPTDSKKIENKELKTIENSITVKEKELNKVNKKIFGDKSFTLAKSESSLRQLKIDSVYRAKELYELYKEYDKAYFKDKVLSILTKSLSVSDLLNLYYSYDYFKKTAIKKVYNVNKYDEIIDYSDNFDLFAIDPTNVITEGLLLFDNENVANIIINKYRLSNIMIAEDDLNIENLKGLMNKILLLLRINKIEHSQTTIEKIWFMVQVEKILARESK